MRRSKVKQMAQKEGVTLAEYLKRGYELFGTQTAFAAQIGVSQADISVAIKEAGLKTKTITILVERKADA